MSKIISFALAIVAIMTVGCASTKLTYEEFNLDLTKKVCVKTN